jgi:uncharacterized membrane protein (UPF0127 family)
VTGARAHRAAGWLVALAALAAVAGCGREGTAAPASAELDAAGAPAAAAAPAPRVDPTVPGRPRALFSTPLGEVTVDVEVAMTPRTRARGLMFRRELAPYAGMLFVFPEAKVQSFWMKNTLIALDMVFIDDAGVVVGVVASAEPQSLVSRHVDGPSRFVVEVRGGWAAAHGVQAGTRVRFSDVDVAAAR